IVWLRRAAQAAGEAEDDNRAVMLARNAAELTEWVSHHTTSGAPPAPEGEVPQGGDELLGFGMHKDSLTFDLNARAVDSVPSGEFERSLRAPSERPRPHVASEAEVLTISEHAPDIELVDPTASQPAIDVGDVGDLGDGVVGPQDTGDDVVGPSDY